MLLPINEYDELMTRLRNLVLLTHVRTGITHA